MTTNQFKLPDADAGEGCLQTPLLTRLQEREMNGFTNDEAAGADPDLWLYRDRTSAMLRRYFRYSIEVGRLPSLLGREFFRTRVTSYRVGTFEDAVIFVHDVERCLDRLDNFERTVIGKVVLQEFSHDEAARLLEKLGSRYSRRSLWNGEPLAGGVLLVDTIGELASLYALADVLGMRGG